VFTAINKSIIFKQQFLSIQSDTADAETAKLDGEVFRAVDNVVTMDDLKKQHQYKQLFFGSSI
jgi:hypothetical protein